MCEPLRCVMSVRLPLSCHSATLSGTVCRSFLAFQHVSVSVALPSAMAPTSILNAVAVARLYLVTRATSKAHRRQL